MCSCPAGYSGKNCGIDIDDCAGVECPGNSTCIDEVDSFTCVCNLGFEGENCTGMMCVHYTLCTCTAQVDSYLHFLQKLTHVT